MVSSDTATVGVSATTGKALTLNAPAIATAGGAFGVTVTVRDQFGNIATGYTGTVHFSSSDVHAVLPTPDYTFVSADHGVHIFTNGVTLETVGSGTQTVTATDNTSSFSGTSTITVNAAAAASLTITAPAGMTAGIPFSVTVTAHDPYGNIATGYTGTVHFSSSDNQAVLPTPD